MRAANRYDQDIVYNRQRTAALARFAADLCGKGARPGIIFVRKQVHADLVAEQLEYELGVLVPVVSSHMPRSEREQLAARLRSSEPNLPLAVSLPIWRSGLDIPNLRWVLLADEGSAPIGLKQGAGRASRIAAGKVSYDIYDWQTIGVSGAYVEHARARAAHLDEAGFGNGGKQTPVEDTARHATGGESDAELLGRLLAAEETPKRAAASPEREATAEPSFGFLVGFTVLAALPLALGLVAIAGMALLLKTCLGIN